MKWSVREHRNQDFTLPLVKWVLRLSIRVSQQNQWDQGSVTIHVLLILHGPTFVEPSGRDIRIRLKARVDLNDQTAEFIPFEVIRTAILTYFYLFRYKSTHFD